MVLLALPPADHLLNDRDRGQFVPSRRRRVMANVRAERLLKTPAEPSPELRIPALQLKREWSPWPQFGSDPGKSARAFKGIICDDISEFESHMPSHAVRSRPAKMRAPPTANVCPVAPRCSASSIDASAASSAAASSSRPLLFLLRLLRS